MKTESLDAFLKRGGAIKKITREDLPKMTKAEFVPIHVKRWKAIKEKNRKDK